VSVAFLAYNRREPLLVSLRKTLVERGYPRAYHARSSLFLLRGSSLTAVERATTCGISWGRWRSTCASTVAARLAGRYCSGR
jgi:hypothetical protein